MKPTDNGAHRVPARAADVAKALNISAATVSRAFSKPEMVNEGVRKEIYSKANELGYVPNSAARALRVRRTNLIALLVPSMDYSIYSKLINSVESVASRSGYLVLVATTGFDREAILSKIKLVIERGAEAVICVGRVDDVPLKTLLTARGIPLVSTYCYEAESVFPCVGFDNYLAGQLIAKYLTSLGHRKVALLLGPLRNNERQVQRRQGFIEAFESNGKGQVELVMECQYRLDEAAHAIDVVLGKYPGVTAVACASDVLAAGAVIRCLETGVAVPGRMSIVGFDDIELIEVLAVKLTTMQVPAAEMGRKAAEAAILNLETGREIVSVELAAALIERQSAAPISC